MINAPYEKEFVFQDGKRAKNIIEISEIAEKISDEEFFNFVNTNKNDFANWINDVLLDTKLAELLRTTISREQTKLYLRQRLQEIISEDVNSAAIAEYRENPQKSAADATPHESAEHHEPQHHANPDHLESEHHLHEPHESEHHDSEHHPHIEHHEHHAHIIEHSKGNKWFEFFSNRKISKKELEKAALAEDDKSRPERELKSELKEESTENIFWILLYGLLIGLIIILLVYKLAFSS